MKLIINSGSVFKGGAEQVALSFIHECRQFPQHEYHVVIGPSIASQLDQDKFPGNFRFYLLNKRPASSVFSYLQTIKWFKELENSVKPDCVISTGGHGHWRPRAPLVGGFNIPHYIYTESAYFDQINLRKKIFWWVMRIVNFRLYNRLDAVLVQTDDVKDRLSKVLSSGSPIFVVSNTINSYFLKHECFPNKLPEKRADEIRLLTLSSYYPHKNLEIINLVTKVLESSKSLNFRFITTLPEGKYSKVFGENRTGMVINVGPVPIRECPSLYRECDFMFLPTLLECFSASYAEAMVMRKPILTSDMSFARTVCRDAAAYFNPTDPDDIAKKIIMLNENHDWQERLIQKGEQISKSFNTPTDRARTFLEICEKISR